MRIFLIVLSLLLFALLLLPLSIYVALYENWNWKKIIKFYKLVILK